MKKNKVEDMLIKYAYKLPPITERQKKYAVSKIPIAYLHYNRKFYNSNGEIDYNIPVDAEIRKAKRKQYIDRFYYTIVTSFKGIQVLRTLWVIRTLKVNSPVEYEFVDLYQNWVMNNNKIYVVGKKLIPMKYDYFNINSDYCVKRKSYYGYDYQGCYMSYIQRLTDYSKKRGITKNNILKDITLEHFFEIVFKDNTIESLLKMGILNRDTIENRNKYFRQMVISNRHHYIPSNWNTWFDYIKLLQDKGDDIYNPTIICVDNLVNKHNNLVARNIEINRRNIEMNNVSDNNKYSKYIKHFKDIVISKDNIVIKPLKSISEFYIEGITMRHCVYQCRYYDKRTSLILSAKDNNDNRIETIEYDIVNNKVIQSRGFCNKETVYHDKILNMMSRLHINKNKTYTIL